LLSLADTLGKGGVEVDQEDWLARINAVVTLLEANFDRQNEVIKPPPLLSGDDVMRELNLQPGPRVGEILEALREAQAAGEVKTKEEALRFVTEYATRNT
jgi:tRNA nucleotidyltransferase/poly(A) polymerase